MQRQEELAFFKAVSTLQVSPTALKVLKTALASSKKKKTLGSAGSRGTTLRPSLNVGKRKAKKLVGSGGIIEPSNRRPAPGTCSAPLPAFTSVTGEQAASGSRQLGPPEGG
jgi:hypothetical protein